MSQRSGLAGIDQSLAYMRRYVDQYKTHPIIYTLSRQLVADLPQKDFMGEARAIYRYVTDRVRYTRDPHGVETLQSPLKTLEIGQGDCDDKATLLVTLLASIGHPATFVAVGRKPGSISHVFVVANIGGKNIRMDCTEPMGMGWGPENIREVRYG